LARSLPEKVSIAEWRKNRKKSDRESGDSWGAILETGNSKLGKEMRIQVAIKFQISSFLESHRENLFGNRTSKTPKNIFLKAIVIDGYSHIPHSIKKHLEII